MPARNVPARKVRRYKNKWNAATPHPAYNPLNKVPCKCGCGELIDPVDVFGVARMWVKGHANRKPEKDCKRTAITILLREADRRELEELAYRTGQSMTKFVRGAWLYYRDNVLGKEEAGHVEG